NDSDWLSATRHGRGRGAADRGDEAGRVPESLGPDGDGSGTRPGGAGSPRSAKIAIGTMAPDLARADHPLGTQGVGVCCDLGPGSGPDAAMRRDGSISD